MNKLFIMGVDIGVSFIKVGLYDIRGHRIATVNKKSPGEYPKPGIFLQSSEKILKIVINAIKEVVKISKIDNLEVEAIGFSGAMGGAMGVDKSWNVITDWSIVSDTRSYPYALDMIKKSRDKILELSGTNFPSFAPKLLWWRKEFPGIYKKVSKFLFLSGFIIARMSDINIEDAFVDRTYLQMTGLANIPKDEWSDEICEVFNINQNLLPRIVDSSTVVGRLNKRTAKECGLKQGTPLVAGAGDKPAGALGAGIVKPGLVIDESASFSAFTVCTDRYVPDVRFKTLENIPSPIIGQYFPSFFIIGSGVTHAWFKDIFGQEEKKIAEKVKKSSYEILDKKAQNVPPGSNALIAIGHLGGRGYQVDPNVRGLWIGHTWNHKKEHFYKSILESFAYEYGNVIDIIKNNYPHLSLKEVNVIGGGSKSDLWNQIKSDVTGLRYVKLNREDATLFGSILIAGHAIGLYEDLKVTALKFTKKIKKYLPNSKNNKIYRKYVKEYMYILKHLRKIYEDIKKLPDYY
ncbi:MAG: hypothetical protein H8E13_13205 [Actinobacteria bacterium]|nr:hypothetical protein [Actinomycetota bacterium]